FPPGEGLHYSDTGFVLAGLVLEHATQTPLHLLYRTYLWEHLGLRHTWLETREPAPPGVRLSHHYADRRDLYEIDMSWDWAGGGLATTATDLARFTHAALDGSLLSLRVRAEMRAWSPHAYGYSGAAVYDRYGLGIGQIDVGGVPLIGATGSWGGFALHHPATATTLAGTVNAFAVDRTPVLQRLLALTTRRHPPQERT
ncbi:MAG: serine hydrolase domain-containing protein, partial [Dermatophilaceae bacterium]